MFSKILIANRGEIAVRILRACRDLGIPAVVAYSEADHDTLAVQHGRRGHLHRPVRGAQELPEPAGGGVGGRHHRLRRGASRLWLPVGGRRLCRGVRRARPGTSSGRGRRCWSDSAASTRCAACWPPTGCRPCRAAAASSPTCATRMEQAQEAGYPVLLKPSAGGGGRGMRLVRSPREMETSLPLARSEAQAAFGDDSIYFEKWIEEARHVEVQVLVDQHGNGVHLGERDCSIQRRHQKIIEEAPSPAMDDGARERLRDLAIRAVVAAGYESAGTLEFLLDKDGNFYFIEINCRIQVEHPGHRDADRPGPHLGADPPRRRRAPIDHPGRGPPGRPRDRVPHQRGGSGRQLLAADRRRRRADAARRAGRPGRHPPVRRLRGAAVLRLAAGQADRVGRHSTRWRWRGRGARWPSSRSAA